MCTGDPIHRLVARTSQHLQEARKLNISVSSVDLVAMTTLLQKRFQNIPMLLEVVKRSKYRPSASQGDVTELYIAMIAELQSAFHQVRQQETLNGGKPIDWVAWWSEHKIVKLAQQAEKKRPAEDEPKEDGEVEQHKAKEAMAAHRSEERRDERPPQRERDREDDRGRPRARPDERDPDYRERSPARYPRSDWRGDKGKGKGRDGYGKGLGKGKGKGKGQYEQRRVQWGDRQERERWGPRGDSWASEDWGNAPRRPPPGRGRSPPPPPQRRQAYHAEREDHHDDGGEWHGDEYYYEAPQHQHNPWGWDEYDYHGYEHE